MAVLRHRRGLWGSELTSRRRPLKAGELGVCPLRHQAFQKPLPRRRLLKGLVHQRTGTQLPPRSKAKAWELGACLLRHQAFQKPLPCWRLLKGLVHHRTDTQLPCDRKRKKWSQPPQTLATTTLISQQPSTLGKTLHQQKDYASLKTHMMVSKF
ncbi:hypothetical protein QTO34_007961 [Cnephaeus nilssonii]|uniref:Uncharacterized protein n=1 Tax=Cnephaeus nilssonii TaxID=3371016 RepID=A0AA40I9C5_CNENI|nr:hypothetical protein QTO34_007961 [Eptesicus nilssonii]